MKPWLTVFLLIALASCATVTVRPTPELDCQDLASHADQVLCLTLNQCFAEAAKRNLNPMVCLSQGEE